MHVSLELECWIFAAVLCLILLPECGAQRASEEQWYSYEDAAPLDSDSDVYPQPVVLSSEVPREGYYDQTCPSAESIVWSTVQDHFVKNPFLAAGLLRLFFHDCFVRGCDASVLLDRTPGGPTPEKESQVNNNSLTGFKVIDKAKKKLERVCPGVVSCSDILALAARDAVRISGGPYWRVPTGRLDGRISLDSDADNEIPPPTMTVRELRRAFYKKGLNTHDLVTLSGAHTIGRAHCFAFDDRLYNFSGTNLPDPTLNQQYLELLQSTCPQNTSQTTSQNTSQPFAVSLDKQTLVLFDNSYYQQLLGSNGLLQTDQQLMFDAATAGLVRAYAFNSTMFFRQFAKSMIKLSKVGLKQAGEGEIRRHCKRINTY